MSNVLAFGRGSRKGNTTDDVQIEASPEEVGAQKVGMAHAAEGGPGRATTFVEEENPYLLKRSPFSLFQPPSNHAPNTMSVGVAGAARQEGEVARIRGVRLESE